MGNIGKFIAVLALNLENSLVTGDRRVVFFIRFDRDRRIFAGELADNIGKKLGIPQRTAEKYVGEYVNKHGLCKRTGNGEYEKVKQQNADERSLLPMLGKC